MKRGFTLIELLVVISIIAVLSTIGLTTYQGTQGAARDSVRKNDLNKLATALELYLQKDGKYPPKTAQSGSENCNRDTGIFYTDIAPYLTGDVPKDPKTNSQYCYISIDEGKGFRLFTKLENCSDSSNTFCGDEYNYTLVSDNLLIAALSGATPPPSTPSPSPSISPSPSPSSSPSPSPSSSPTSSPTPSAPSFVALSESSETSGSSYVVNKPSSTVDNQFMLAHVTHLVFDGSPASITAPSGWNQALLSTTEGAYNSSTKLKSVVYWKIAAAEPSSYTWNFSKSVSAGRVVILTYQGVRTVSPLFNASGGSFVTNTTSPSTPSITTSVNNTALVAFYLGYGPSVFTFTSPTGMTPRYNFNIFGNLAVLATDSPMNSAGSTGGKTANASAPVWALAQIIAINPP